MKVYFGAVQKNYKFAAALNVDHKFNNEKNVVGYDLLDGKIKKKKKHDLQDKSQSTYNVV